MLSQSKKIEANTLQWTHSFRTITEAETLGLSVYQSNDSWSPIRCCQSNSNPLSSQSHLSVNPLPIHWQSISNFMSFHSCANLLSIWSQSKANRLPNLITWASIECQSCLNPLPILCQSCDNPVSILSQSSVNTISIITSNWDANPHHMLVKLI